MFVITIMYAYFIDILQGSVEMHLWCGGIYNNHIIANCLQSVQWKNFENWSIIGEDMDKSKVARFLAHLVVIARNHLTLQLLHLTTPVQGTVTTLAYNKQCVNLTAHVTELRLTVGSGLWNGDEHCHTDTELWQSAADYGSFTQLPYCLLPYLPAENKRL